MEGVNLLDAGSAPRVIKTWDDRLIEEGVESGVDDEVSSDSNVYALRLIMIPQLILHIPFTQSLRVRTLLLLPPPPSHPHRPTRTRLFANLLHCPDFNDLEGLTPIMDFDSTSPPHGVSRTLDGRREIEEWGLKVQKLASVHSITLLFVRISFNSMIGFEDSMC